MVLRGLVYIGLVKIKIDKDLSSISGEKNQTFNQSLDDETGTKGEKLWLK